MTSALTFGTFIPQGWKGEYVDVADPQQQWQTFWLAWYKKFRWRYALYSVLTFYRFDVLVFW